MPRLARFARLAPLLALTLLAGCTDSAKEAAKASASAAIDAAEAAIRPVKFEATRYAPKQLEIAQATLLKAREKAAAGDYQGALALTGEVKAKIQEMAASIEKSKAQLQAEFKASTAGIPERLEAVKKRLAELGTAKKLPKGLDAAKVQAAKEDLEAAVKGWELATAKATEGSLGEALAFVESTRAKLGSATQAAGLPAPKP